MPRKRSGMARNRAQQRATRERMGETGENYTTARTALQADKLDLTKLTTTELIQLLQKVNSEYASRSDGELVTKLREVVAQDEDIQSWVELHGDVVRAYFDTTDYENGYFFSHYVTLVFADGTGDSFEMDALEDTLSEVSSAWQPLTGRSTYMVDLMNGGVGDFDEYGHHITEEPRDAPRSMHGYEVKATRVYQVGLTEPQFAWECATCQALSHLRWDSENEAAKALANHLRADNGGDEPVQKEKPKRYCFYVDESMNTPNGYIPSMVTEDEPGHAPMIGNGELSQPWYWGTDIDTARRIARESNHKLGLTDDDVEEIMQSSITASIREQGRKDAAQERLDNLRRGIS